MKIPLKKFSKYSRAAERRTDRHDESSPFISATFRYQRAEHG